MDQKSPKIHPFQNPAKGAVVGYKGKVAFLNPGDTFRDARGRVYRVAEDGSLRRVKK